jgi:hypothetical protein
LNQNGSLFFDLEGTQSRLIGPEIDLEADHFVITGAGPGDLTFSLDTSVDEPLLNDLASGLWDISGQMFNADGDLIASGTATANVTPGGYTVVFIPFQPIVGNGNLQVTLSWPVGELYNPRIDATLQLVGGKAISADFQSLDDGNPETVANLLSTQMEAGYYLLSIQVFDKVSETDDETKVAGGTELVRIIANEDSIGSLTLNTLNSLQGSMGFLFEWDPQNTVPLEMTASPELIGEMYNWIMGLDPQVTITAEPRGITYTVDFYLDGSPFSPDYVVALDPGPDSYAGADVTLDTEGIGLGYHRMDVVLVFDDGIIGMMGFEFYIGENTET